MNHCVTATLRRIGRHQWRHLLPFIFGFGLLFVLFEVFSSYRVKDTSELYMKWQHELKTGHASSLELPVHKVVRQPAANDNFMDRYLADVADIRHRILKTEEKHDELKRGKSSDRNSEDTGLETLARTNNDENSAVADNYSHSDHLHLQWTPQPIHDPFQENKSTKLYSESRILEDKPVTVSPTFSMSRNTRKDSLLMEEKSNGNIPYFDVPGTDCAALFAGDDGEKYRARMKQFKMPKQPIPDGLYVDAARNCTQFINARHYVMQPLSEEEASFSIAFSILMFRDVEQFERLFRAIYRPQNFYCVHVDRNSPSIVHSAVGSIISCFTNAFVIPSIYVQWGAFSTVEPELACMKALMRYSRKWRYFINLTGQEFPLKTNWDIVKILKVFNGSNNMEGTVERRDDTRFIGKPPLPVEMTLTKGSVHIVVTRAFVEFVLYSETAIKFKEWVKDTYIPDETFFSSLNHNPQLGVPGAFLGRPETDTHKNVFIARFKNWGDGPFDWPCYGQRVRYVCVFGIGDLPLLSKRPELFANKFYLDFEPIALDCMEQLHYNRTFEELTGVATFNTSFYEDLAFVKNHQ